MALEKSKVEIMEKEFVSRDEALESARKELKKHKKLYEDLAKL
jgi:hypothetical protein